VLTLKPVKLRVTKPAFPNRPFRDWGRIFDVDNTLATAMIDRLMHHGEAMVIQGSSFRTKGETPDE